MTKHEFYDIKDGEVRTVRLDDFDNSGFIRLRKDGLKTTVSIGGTVQNGEFTLGELEIGVLKSLLYEAEREIENARRAAKTPAGAP